MQKKILVIGSGSWGLALTQTLLDNGQDVVVYGNNPDEIDELISSNTNSKFFSNVIIGRNDLTARYIDQLNQLNQNDYFNWYPDIVLLAVPTKAINNALETLKPYISKKRKTIFLNVSKGFDENGNRISELVRNTFPDKTLNPFISLLGPSHAEEVVNRKLTFVNIVDEDLDSGYMIQRIFTNDYFKCSVISDLLTAELATAMKNIVAIMSGIFVGLGYGDNARAALFSMGLKEIYTLLKSLNSNIDPEFLLGFCGAGDLAVTCYSNFSRNFTAGKKIGELNSYSKFKEQNKTTVESLNAIDHLYNLAKEQGADVLSKLNIVISLYAIAHEVGIPNDVVSKLIIKEYNKIV